MRAELEAWRLGIPQPRLTVLLHGLDRLPAVDRVMRLGLREAAALAVNRKAERIQAVWRGYSARKELLPRSANSLLPGRSWPLSRSFLDSVLAHPGSDVRSEAVKVLDTGLYHAVWQFTALGDGALDLFREDSGRSPVRLRVVDRPDWHVHADAVSVEEAAQLEFVLRPLVCERWSAKRSNTISGPLGPRPTSKLATAAAFGAAFNCALCMGTGCAKVGAPMSAGGAVSAAQKSASRAP